MSKFLLKSALKWLLAISITFLVFLFAFSAGAFLYKKRYENKIYPGVKIGSLDLSGLTIEEAKKIQETVDEIIKNEIGFCNEETKISISPLLISTADPSLIKEILVYDEQNMLKSAYKIGRNEKDIGTNFLKQIKLLIDSKQLLPLYGLDEDELINIMRVNFSSNEKQAKDAFLKIDDAYNIELEEEKTGHKIVYETAVLNLIKELDKFSKDKISIDLKKIIDEPKIKRSQVLPAIEEAAGLLKIGSLEFSYASSTWIVEKNIFKKWITLNPDYLNAINSPSSNYPFITLDKELLIEYLSKNIAPKINIAPQNAKFEIKDGKVIEFQESRDGLELDLEKNYEFIRSKVIEHQEKRIEIIVKEIKADINTENINNLGIKEIIGVGKSNFKGSPNNRRHNIKTGSSAINGLIVAPEENFSLVSSLGEIDWEHGYLPELVIKGNKTIPEYGGGLCQIGTTLFRAALDSGLPITERQNHSYRVSYYEPAGTDATIYNPRPDMKFLNDTGYHILVQTKIEGNDLVFELWGTKDGRIVEKEEPRIYNIVKPGPTKIIETEDMAPGEKKCTETSHNGADAEFNYKVTYPNGEIKEKLFKSHYKPWQAVCLVGVEKAEIQTASTTVEVVE